MVSKRAVTLLKRKADKVLRDGVEHPVVTLELPALPERGWKTPRIFFVGEWPAGIEEALFELEDDEPGWPSTPEVRRTIAAMTGDDFDRI